MWTYPFQRFTEAKNEGLGVELPPWIEEVCRISTILHNTVGSPEPPKPQVPAGSTSTSGQDPVAVAPPAAEHELSDVEKIQKTAAVILDIKTSVEAGLKILDEMFLESSSVATAQKNQDLTTDQLEILKTLKERLGKVLAKMDSEFLKFSTQSDPLFAWTNWSNLSEERQTIERLLGQLPSTSSRPKPEQSLNRSQEEVLADIVGLRREVGQDLLKEPDHETAEDQIHRYLDVVHNNCLQDLGDLSKQEYLVRLGFTEQQAKIIAEAIGPNSGHEHITTLDYVHIFVQNLFNYNVLLTDELSSLPDRSQADGKPYPTEAFANGATKRSILCCNFQEPAELEKELNKFFDTEEGFDHWFHGTDSASATKIAVEMGVKTAAGNEARDFSDGDGFYCSDSFQRAQDWAKHRGFTACDYYAILRYKVSRDLLHGEEPGLHLSFPEQKELWKKTIRHFRSEGRDGAGDQDLIKLLKDVAFIIGPLSTDGSWRKNKNNPGWPEPLCHDSNQLCIRSKTLALKFNLCLDKIAFVKKTQKY